MPPLRHFAFVFRRRFFLFFICQFLGALNDNIFRLSFIALLSFGAIEGGAKLVPLVLALFMLPFFLFSAVAGKLTDSIGKRRMLRLTKLSELIIMTLAGVGIADHNAAVLFAAIFLTGAQSAFFGPLKYAVLPDIVRKQELVDANALVSVSTMLSILLGVIIGSALGAARPGAVAVLMPLISLAGLAAAWRMPPLAGEPAPRKINRGDFRLWRVSKTVVQETVSSPFILRHLIAISWFWVLGGQLLGELPQLGDEALYRQLLTLSVLGVGVGMGLCFFIFRGDINTQYTPLSLAAAGVFLLLAAGDLPAADAASPFFVFCLMASCAAIIVYVVPLSASLQKNSDPAKRAQTMGTLNIFNALFIVIASLVAVAAHFALESATALIFAAVAVASFAVAVWSLSLIPLEAMRKMVAVLFRFLFRAQVQGVHHLQKHPRAVIIANHVSLLDAPLLSVFLSRPGAALSFAIDVEQAKRFYVRPLLKFVNAHPINTLNPYSIRRLIEAIKAHPENRFAIFPEGRITVTGGLMKNYPGAALIAMKTGDGWVVPVHIEGAQYSKFSYLRGKLRQKWFPPITLTVGEPVRLWPPPHLKGRRQRQWLSDETARILNKNGYRPATIPNLTRAVILAAQNNGFNLPVLAELPQRTLTYRTLFRAAFALGKKLPHREGEKIGVLLPSSLAAATLFYAAVFRRLTPVMLNPGTGERQVLSACKTAAVTTVYTGQILLDKSPAAAAIARALQDNNIAVVLLDEVRESITPGDKLLAAAAARFAASAAKTLPGHDARPDEAAAILFTSGSESEPKGVVLSHSNLLANSAQILGKLNVHRADILLNTLPVFHSFGLMAGVILPLTAGAKTFQYPTPLHYRLIPEIIYLSNATVFFSTDTFLLNYGNAAHSGDFTLLRLVVAGAEKLKEPTRKLWREKFGIRIMEGYGVTETSPAVAFNTTLENKDGTVGRVLQGIETRLEKIADLPRGGRLYLRGANIMQGYYLADAPGRLRPPPDGWHDTGDIADIDEDGYLTILGRAKRFAKVAGEMVPLDGVENALRREWPDKPCVVIARHDGRRGESLVLLTPQTDARREDILAALKRQKLPDLWAPRHILPLKEIPLLATGKVDYPAVAALAERQMTAMDDKSRGGD